MKFFIPILALCVIQLSLAQLQDSPEVVAAKAAHYEAVRRAELVIATAPPYIKDNTEKPKVEETSQHKLGVNVHDTPEVAAAKEAHFEAIKKAEHATAVANGTSRVNVAARASVTTTHHTKPQSTPDGYQNIIHIELPSSEQYPIHSHRPTHHYPTGYYPSTGHHPTTGFYPSSSHYPTSDYYQPPTYNPDYYPDHHHHHHHHHPTDHQTPAATYYPSHHHHHVKSVVETTQHKLGEVVHDTPEVAAVKAAHFEAVRKAEQAAVASNPNDDGSYVVVHENKSPIIAVVPEPVYLPDTPEVAAAKAIHYEALKRAQGAAAPQQQNRVQLVPVLVVSQANQHQLGVNVRDTPEVAAAKAAHFEAVRQAQLVAAKEALQQPVGAIPINDYFHNPTRPYGQV